MVVPLRILYPRKKIVMHYHGTMVRQETKGRSMRLGWERFVDMIMVSTPDLLDLDYRMRPHYVPNPVDTELFCPRVPVTNGKALIVLKKGQSLTRTASEIRKHGLDLTLDMVRGVPYPDMPDTLARCEYYADLPAPGGRMIEANSLTGLQAMSMGIRVISWDYSVRDSLPEEHMPENVVRLLDRLYSKC